jgi:farnesyl diphosphate synthase
LGQLLDLTSQPLDQSMDLDRFSMERLTSIFKYKTAFYSFYLPVALGMILSGVTDKKLYDKAREILCIMGEYFQIQDDFLDCYGTPEIIGKVGTDIQVSTVLVRAGPSFPLSSLPSFLLPFFFLLPPPSFPSSF